MTLVLWIVTVFVVVVVFATCKEMAKTPGSEKALRWTLGVGAAAIGVMWWAASHYFGERAEAGVKVNESVFSSYSREQYPKTYNVWGDGGVQKIKEVERLAAVKAARQRECDNVYYIGLAETRSSPPSQIVVFADCENGWRFYIDQSLEILESRKVN